MEKGKDIKIGFLGAGNMAEAMVRGLIAAGTPAGRLVAGEISAERRQAFTAATGVEALADNPAVIERSDLVVLAVKPQVAAALLEAVGAKLGPEKLVLSVMAGWTTKKISSFLPAGARVVRAMPNTPLLAGRGVVGLCAGPGAGAGDREAAAALFAGTARVFCFDEEEKIDAVTAVSGSGPAYVFYLVEALAAAGEALGLEAEDAAAMARETFAGALALLEKSGEEPAALRRKVTSPGGTTEAALKTMAAEGLREAFGRAVAAAARRSRELGG